MHYEPHPYDVTPKGWVRVSSRSMHMLRMRTRRILKVARIGQLAKDQPIIIHKLNFQNFKSLSMLELEARRTRHRHGKNPNKLSGNIAYLRSSESRDSQTRPQLCKKNGGFKAYFRQDNFFGKIMHTVTLINDRYVHLLNNYMTILLKVDLSTEYCIRHDSVFTFIFFLSLFNT